MSEQALRTIFGEIRPRRGFHDVERDVWGPFVWTEKSFTLRRPPQGSGSGCYLVRLCYYGSCGFLLVRRGSDRERITLHKGWNVYPVDLAGGDGDDIEFEISDIVAVPQDARELGVMIRRFRPLRIRSTTDELRRVLANKIENDREYAEGRTVLQSVPSKLRINTATRCTMRPPCAYCDWNRTKMQESESDFTVTLETLGEMGDFYALAEEIVDNSYGEPLLNAGFSGFLDVFGKEGKYFEVGSNGQLLNEKNRNMLLGRELVLYVSADAATPEAYARYRDDKFDLLIENLRALCRERRAHCDLPKVIISFVAMRSNHNEIGPFLDLMKDVGVDGIKFIYLDPDAHLEERVVRRNGFTFDYKAELLGLSELLALCDEAKAMAAEKGVAIMTRLDFGCEEAAGEGPLCSEPWRNIHILDRGIVACLFSRVTPVAKWAERGERGLEEFVRDVWNGESYRHMRAELREGRLPELCRGSWTCPIVWRARHGSSGSGKSGTLSL
jgi:MoaA/NifB/PqqE/SkfB family radical SAM enzyme